MTALLALTIISASPAGAQVELLGPDAIASHGNSLYMVVGDELIRLEIGSDLEVEARVELERDIWTPELTAFDDGVCLSGDGALYIYNHDLELQQSVELTDLLDIEVEIEEPLEWQDPDDEPVLPEEQPQDPPPEIPTW